MTIFVSTQSHRVYQYGDDRLVFYSGDCLDFDALRATENKFGKPELVIGDGEGTVLDIGIPFYFIPELVLGMFCRSARYLQESAGSLETDLKTDHCFCWSINRKTIDRYLVIKILEWLELSAPYTWSGIGRSADCSSLLNEMDSIQAPWFTDDLRSFLLSPIQMPERYIIEPGIIYNQSLVQAKYSNNFNDQWKYVQCDLASTCGVYLLTESFSGLMKNFTFSEKTGWAMMAGNFPIWAGNYGQAYQAAVMGIDIFPDVINHDYQWCDTIIERCYRAINDNRSILTNLSLVQHLRKQHQDRLLANREWYLGIGLKKYVDFQKNELISKGIEIDHFGIGMFDISSMRA